VRRLLCPPRTKESSATPSTTADLWTGRPITGRVANVAANQGRVGQPPSLRHRQRVSDCRPPLKFPRQLPCCAPPALLSSFCGGRWSWQLFVVCLWSLCNRPGAHPVGWPSEAVLSPSLSLRDSLSLASRTRRRAFRSCQAACCCVCWPLAPLSAAMSCTPLRLCVHRSTSTPPDESAHPGMRFHMARKVLPLPCERGAPLLRPAWMRSKKLFAIWH